MLDDPVLWFSICVLFSGIGALVYLAHVAVKASAQDQAETAHETRKIFVAAGCLLGVGLLFIEAMLLYYCDSTQGAGNLDIGGAGKDIFDACKTILPPIATLILGYYFGTNRSSAPQQTHAQQTHGTVRDETPETGN